MTRTMKRMLVVVAMLGTACGLNPEPSPTRLVQLQVSPPTASVPVGIDQQLTAVAIFENGRRQNVSDQVTWTTGDEAIAQVDASGLVTTASQGTARVGVSLGGLSAYANLVVSDATLVSIDLIPSVLRIPLGATLGARSWGSYSDGSRIDLTTRSAWSTTTDGLTLLAAGQSRAAVKGPVRLCVRFQAMQAAVDLEVTDAALVALQVATSRSLAALPKGAISVLTVTAEFTDATVLDITGDVTWRSSDLGVAEVVSSRVRGVGHGNARIGAAYLGMSTVVEIAVSSAEVVGLALYPPAATAPAGDFAKLTAMATYSDGSLGDVSEQVTWSSLDPESVQLSNTEGAFGHAYGMKRGHQAVVTAQLEGMAVSATTLVEVGAPSVKSIAIDQTGPELTVSVGDDLQLTATAVLSDDLLDLVDDGEEEADEHHDFTSRLQWESLDTNVAVADPEEPGKFHAVAAGQVTIMATLPGSDFSMQVSIIVID